ncbi:MAG: alpha/beta hydrolase [Deltaproteobacteria bacterium]|nr:alpha/beta hydrolase [Candidatus Zymogenaceae bacterium]
MKKILSFIGVIILILILAVAVNWGVQELRPVKMGLELVEDGNFIDIDGIGVHYWDQGKGDVLILVHGFSSNVYTWRLNVDALSEEFRVIALDLPGFGYTDNPKDFDYTHEGYSRFLVDFMDAMDIDTATLAGNSMGGGVVLTTALLFPERVDGLILVDSVGYPEQEDEEKVFLPFLLMGVPGAGEVLMSLSYRSVLEESLKGGVYYDNSFVTEEMVEYYYNVYRMENGRKAPLWVMRNMMDIPPIGSERISEVSAPTLIIWGEEDNLIPVGHASLFERDIAGSRAVVIGEAGHLPHEEKAEFVNGLIADFMKEGN